MKLSILILSVILASFALTGCGPPGRTVKVIGATPASIVMEYTHWYGGELNSAMANAEAHCNQYGKHAQMMGKDRAGPNPVDRSIVTFNCVK